MHRSFGVHISFVRSIAMDSWTPAQMQIMKLGGNQQCQSYLSSHGIFPSTPIKAKYESDVAQLYKEILKARAEGRPEPTELTKRVPASGNTRPMSSISSMGGGGFGGGGAKGAEDPNGMERLTGESDEMYIARQTRLRNEAKARMAAKFGSGGMGGVGGGGGMGGGMGGIGSDPNYNRHSGYGSSDFDVSALSSTVISGLGSAFGALSTVANSVTSAVTDESTKRQLADVSTSVASTAGNFWGGLSAGASKLISNVTQSDDAGSDGLADLQRQFHSQRSTNPNSKYSGFGSDGMMGGSGSANNIGGGSSGGGWGSMGSTATPFSSPTMPATNSMLMTSSSTLREAMAGPGEDPNGIERLSGESDEQYVMRQTRLRNEAKARMAAKFGGGGMGGVGSSGMGSSGGGYRGGMHSTPTSTVVPAFAVPHPAAPSSGNATKMKVPSGDDFFANFGS